jgi:hypothetical protein
MKRSICTVTFLTIIAGFVFALPPGRTMVNPEGKPLVYVFIPEKDLPEEFAERDTAPSAIETAFLLREHQEQLAVIPPGGMWRIPRERGILAGYFHSENLDDETAGYPFVSMVLSSGSSSILAVPATGAVVGSTPRLTPRQIPPLDEPILLDGLSHDWPEGESFRLPEIEEPGRAEIAGSGREVTAGHTRHFRTGGTGVLRLAQVMGRRSWYVSLTTANPIVADTYYYFRLYQGDDRETFLGDIIVPVLGSSGPVVFRDLQGSLEAVGQYATEGDFLEWAIGSEYVSEILPSGEGRFLTADLAVGTGTGPEREIYTLMTLTVGEDIPHL